MDMAKLTNCRFFVYSRGLGHAPMSRLPGEIGHATFPRHPERLHLPLLPHDAKREVGTLEATYERIRLADAEMGIYGPRQSSVYMSCVDVVDLPTTRLCRPIGVRHEQAHGCRSSIV
eukprot:SAG11_NODE_1773_length_4272_cov_6.865085_3_plen_117_part_00